MIGRLRGVLLDAASELVLVECGGVGYELELTLGARAALAPVGQEVVVHTHLVVRDDGHFLFGFASAQERDLFRVLIRTSGVGPKLAMAILSTVAPADLVNSVAAGDSGVFTRVSGVCKKTAARLLVELKDRLDALDLVPASLPSAPAPTQTVKGVLLEAERALVALGYRPAEATRMVAAVAPDDAEVDAADLVRAALRRAGQQSGENA